MQVYCDMDRVCGCNSTGGWTCLPNLDISYSSEWCPGEWIMPMYNTEPRRICGKSATAMCVGERYQYASTDVIDHRQLYVDGVSFTLGLAGTRQHIWTFPAGISESFVCKISPQSKLSHQLHNKCSIRITPCLL